MDVKSAVTFAILCFVTVKAQDLDKPEGSPCRWENLTGTCVDARKCTTFEADVQKKNHPPICSFQGKYAIICCTACLIHKEIPIIPTPPPLPKLLAKCREYFARLPYKCKGGVKGKPGKWKSLDESGKCYNNRTEMQVAPAGGEDARRDEHPHMALLGYGSEQDTAQWLCAGSVISERYILTAAHCAAQPQLGPVKFVGLGILKRSDPPHLWQVYTVKRFIPHPGYKAPLKYDDIALIETTSPINFSIPVMPACVGEKDIEDNKYLDFNTAHALGWGGLGHRKENADTLQEVTLQKFTTAECSGLYPPHRHLPRGYDPATQVCYGDRGLVRDTCAGDSGGPLIRLINGLSCASHIVGVTSYGLDCGFAGNAGIYTRVETYEPWIEGIVFP